MGVVRRVPMCFPFSTNFEGGSGSGSSTTSDRQDRLTRVQDVLAGRGPEHEKSLFQNVNFVVNRRWRCEWSTNEEEEEEVKENSGCSGGDFSSKTPFGRRKD